MRLACAGVTSVTRVHATFEPMSDERKAADAACVYLRAYAARCHHAVGGDATETGLAEIAATLL
jgi:hypothetical protein